MSSDLTLRFQGDHIASRSMNLAAEGKKTVLKNGDTIAHQTQPPALSLSLSISRSITLFALLFIVCVGVPVPALSSLGVSTAHGVLGDHFQAAQAAVVIVINPAPASSPPGPGIK